MKISLNWLCEYLKSPVTKETITQKWADKLTLSGLEVESITPYGVGLENIRVGHIVSVAPHPNADRLGICQVRLEKEADLLTIVCGAPNARAELKVAVATVGTVLPNGLKIGSSKIRGVLSNGMLCSESEMGLHESMPGILELPQDAPVGTSLSEYLGFPDTIWDINITPNRGDCLSVLGIVRELNAALDLSQTDSAEFNVSRLPSAETALAMTKEKILLTANTHSNFHIQIQDAISCPRYIACIIRDIHLDAMTPIWMQERLRRNGMRAIHPVVDILNYVMIELGQPMHAFDLSTLSGNQIVVRQSQPGEQAKLLDEKTYTLNEPALVIADDKGILALAGIMGGADSAVYAHTTNVLIESAHFVPNSISSTLRRLNIQSDAAHRFERGVDPELPLLGLQRAITLLQEICGGNAEQEIVQGNSAAALRTVNVRQPRIQRLLGITLEDNVVENLLNKLNLNPVRTNSGWSVTVPSYRFDLNIEADIIEEIARTYGYENIPSQTLVAPLKIQPSPEAIFTPKRIRHHFADLGYQETIHYSFISPKFHELLDPEQAGLALANPISSDLSVMRTTLWAGLIQSAVFNLNRRQASIRLFEMGTCFHSSSSKPSEVDHLKQNVKLAGVLAGPVSPLQWSTAERDVDFFDLKGDLEHFFSLYKNEHFEWHSAKHPALHPGKSSKIERNGLTIGYVGELHPDLQAAFDISQPLYLFELDMESLKKGDLPKYITPSKYPSIKRDIAFILPDTFAYHEIEQLIQSEGGETLQMFQLFDIYTGQGIPSEHKSLAVNLTFQSATTTLTDNTVDEAVQRIVSGLHQRFKATLRE